tara:strand:+ start:7269 stop:8048 length:780 start_codon:yes stop_codon:yes gene_type:complete
MGNFMSPVIDNSPIDQFGAGTNAAQLANYSQTAFNRSNELFNPYSIRNQLIKQSSTEDALNLQAQGNIMNRRNAASFGIGGNFAKTALENQNLMNKIQNQSTKDFLSNLNQQTQLAQGFSGQAGQFTSQGAGIKNNLNQLFRQRSAANQQAKQKSNAMKFDLFKQVASPLMGPALGAMGGMLGGGLLGMGSGQGFGAGVQQYASNSLNPTQINQNQGFNNSMGGMNQNFGFNMPNIANSIIGAWSNYRGMNQNLTSYGD